MATSYGTIPYGSARRPMQRGTVLTALFLLGVVALASVVLMSHSFNGSDAVVDLAKVSSQAATQVYSESLAHYYRHCNF